MNTYRPTTRDAAASWNVIRAHNAGLIDLPPGALEALHLIADAYDRDESVSSETIRRAQAAIYIDRSLTQDG